MDPTVTGLAIALGVAVLLIMLLMVVGAGYAIAGSRPQFELVSCKHLERLHAHTLAVAGALEKSNAPYTAQGGTLLGMARKTGMIQWDDDSDFSMREQDIEAGMQALRDAGLHVARREWGYKIFPKADIKDIWVDIFELTMRDGMFKYKCQSIACGFIAG